MNNYMEITYVASWCIIVLTAIILIASVYFAIKEYLDKQDDQEASEEEYDGDKEYWRNRAKTFREWYHQENKNHLETLEDYASMEHEILKLEEENADLRYQLRQYEEAKERKNVTAATNSGNEQPREEFIDRRNADV